MNGATARVNTSSRNTTTGVRAFMEQPAKQTSDLVRCYYAGAPMFSDCTARADQTTVQILVLFYAIGQNAIQVS